MSEVSSYQYETDVKAPLLRQIWNEGQGLPVSMEYSDNQRSNRKFIETENQEAFRLTKDWLEKNEWPAEKRVFKETELDVLFHVYQDPSESVDTATFGDCLKSIRKGISAQEIKTMAALEKEYLGEAGVYAHPRARQPVLDKQISDAAIEYREKIPNMYAYFEVTLDVNRTHEKLEQLERNMAVLLMRKRLQEQNDSIRVGQIFRLVGLVTPNSAKQRMFKEILDHGKKFSLLLELLCLDRVFCLADRPNRKAITDSVSANSALRLALMQSDLDTKKELNAMKVKQEEMKLKEAEKEAKENEVKRLKNLLDCTDNEKVKQKMKDKINALILEILDMDM